MVSEIKGLLFFLVSTAIVSCSGSALEDEPSLEQTVLPMDFEILATDTSRGQATTADNLDEFAVSCTVYSPAGDRSLYFAHEKYRIQKEGQDVYRTITGNVHYWLSSKDEYNFFAYTPSPYIYFESGVVDKFIYTTPKNILQHPDLVVATSIAAQYGKVVQLQFAHPLAQISLYESSNIRIGKIHSITFSGIIDHGQYDMLTGEWLMNIYDTDSFTWDCDKVTQPDTNLSGEYFNFFFVPQQLGLNAAITVIFENVYGIIETHTVPISGSWQAGHHYRYSLSL